MPTQLFLYREAYYLQGRLNDPVQDEKRVARLHQVLRKLEINIAKHRSGPTAVLDLFLDVPAIALRSEPPYDPPWFDVRGADGADVQLAVEPMRSRS
jgi:hypothetical protein